MQRDAFSLLIGTLKNESYNSELYQEVCIRAQSVGVDPVESEVDQAWIEKVNSHVSTRRAEIDRNLQLAKTSVRNDDIRRCYMEKGALFHMVGEYQRQRSAMLAPWSTRTHRHTKWRVIWPFLRHP